MLTVDLVNVRRRSGELKLVSLDAKRKERARDLARTMLAIAKEQVGGTREELEEALSAVPCAPSERRLRDGIEKLVQDRCAFDAESDQDPAELRRELFARATELRRALADGERLDRDGLVASFAEAKSLGHGELERALYSDLRSAHVLQALDPIAADALVAGYDLAQAQAVLLRAVRVVVLVSCSNAAGYRKLFRRLKFLRLLHRIERKGSGYRIEIDGPFSMFESVTKYGLKLALVVPSLEDTDEYHLEADVRWGKARDPLVFKLSGGGGRVVGDADDALPDEVGALLDGLRAQTTPWRARRAGAILELPGIGASIPDLVLEHEQTGEAVFVEVMGYWSREAVWKRVELVRAGLPQKVLFALSKRLRVSEDVLEDDLPAALYVYKGVMSPRAVLERVERLGAREGSVAGPLAPSPDPGEKRPLR